MILADRVIVIVGGTSGLGLSAALACKREGAHVVVIGPDAADFPGLHEILGSDTVFVVGNAIKSDTGQRAIDAAIGKHGRLDGLYHVAGGSGRRQGDGPLESITPSGWQYTLDLNLTSVFYSNQAAVRQFQKQGAGGSIVNVGSVLASSPSPVHFATHAYTAAKSALFGFTKACAAYYASASIRFNLLLPGLIQTPMSQRACENPAIASYIDRKQPLDGGRAGDAADLDAAVVYLLSEASRFVTGQVLAVDGGWSVSEASP